MTLADMALEAANVNKSRCLNALSIPLLSTTGKVEGLSELHEYVEHQFRVLLFLISVLF